MQQNEVFAPAVSAPRLHTIRQFAERFPAWSAASLRALIYAAQDRTASGGRVIRSNGLEASGAVVRLSSRVLLDETKFFQWLAEQQRARRNGAA